MSKAATSQPWQVAILGDYCERPQYGYTASAVNEPIGPKFLRITDIQLGKVDWTTVPYCSAGDEARKVYGLIPGDLVVARIGATTGKAFLIRSCPPALFASYLIRLRTKTELLPDFLAFFCESDAYWQQIDQVKGGRLKGGVNIPVLRQLTIPIPPLPEQRAIARALRAVQEAKEARRREAALERERKAALMQHLFTHGTCEEATKQTEIGDIPESWEVATLGEIAKSISTGTTPATDSPQYYGGTIPFIKTSEIVNSRITEAATHITKRAITDYNLKLFSKGTLFLAMYGQGKTRGQVGLLEVPATTTQNTGAIVVGDRADPEYVWHWLMGQYARLRESGSQGHISHLNIGYVKRFPIALPSVSEQKAIVTCLEACDAKIAAVEREATVLDELFRALLEELMTGRLSALPLAGPGEVL